MRKSDAMNKPRRKRKKLFTLLCSVLALLLLAACFPGKLTVTAYTHAAPLDIPIRIVQLSDLHNAEFGENNGQLIAAVREQAPDLIVMTGDMLNRDDPDLAIVRTLIAEMAEIAPVYYGYGNHEYTWEALHGASLREVLSAAGAVVLNKEFRDITVNGNEIRIGGYMGFYWQPHMLTSDPDEQALERVFYKEFEDTGRYKILLNHIPTQWIDWEYVNLCPVDLVFCGHYHGGGIRIPFLDRGVFAPYIGFFPRFTKGMDEGIVATCVLSAGFGSEHLIPRINNPPEIVVLDLIPAAE